VGGGRQRRDLTHDGSRPAVCHPWAVRIGILGPLELQRDGVAAPAAGRRVAALLARLALDCGRLVSADALIDAVWEEALPADPGHALQTLVSRLRRALGGAELLVQESGGYRLALSPGDIDALQFERLAGEGAAALRAGDPGAASALLAQALGLWRGPALAGLAGEHRFAGAAADRLDELRRTARANRIAAELALGRGAALVPELEALLADHPLDERLAAHHIAALAADARPADALAAYERMRRRLDDELGALPSAELQAAHAAVLRGDAPAAPAETRASNGARTTNLPHPRSSFVGRAPQVTEIGALLGEHRLVTLVGTGGAGKTRLAVEAGREQLAATRDGVWLAELAAVSAGGEVADAVLDALGLREVRLLDAATQPVAPRPPRNAHEALCDALAPRETLLVLDNCEHVVDSAARLADELLAACPRLRILATSREPLKIAGERLLALAPLAVPEDGGSALTAAEALAHPAVRLLADRGAAAAPGFAVDDANVAAVAEICRRLDGLPLAIELAAARLRSLSAQQIADRLDDRFRLLTGGSRTALPRQRTLRAVIDWSWDLLSEPERTLAARLAVFGAGVTPQSATAVCPQLEPGEVLDLLGALVDRSLLQVADAAAPRYRMLETLREYGIEKLAQAGELAAARTTHAHYFGALVDEAEPHLRRPEQLEWFHRLRTERENVLAALRHLCATGDAHRALRLAVSLGWFWLLSGSSADAKATMQLAAAVPGDADPVDRLIATAFARETDASHDELRGAFALMLDALERAGSATRPLVTIALPLLAMFAGQPERSERLFEDAAADPDPWIRAAVPMARAQLAENEGDVDTMRVQLAAALEGFRDVGDRWALALALTSWGALRTIDGALDDAAAALDEARGLLDSLQAGFAEPILLLRLADVRMRQGDLAAAAELLEHAGDSGTMGGEQLAITHAARARLALEAGDLPQARAHAAEAERQLEGLAPNAAGRSHGDAMVNGMTAMLACAGGDTATAGQAMQRAYDAGVLSGDMPILAAIGVGFAHMLDAAGDPAGAAEVLGASATLRGAEDLTGLDIARLHQTLRAALGERRFTAAYERGRALDRAAAIERLDPAVLSGAPGVGP
jgi:predicted ATPase/DNA-binding SARP family transcriptional activator